MRSRCAPDASSFSSCGLRFLTPDIIYDVRSKESGCGLPKIAKRAQLQGLAGLRKPVHQRFPTPALDLSLECSLPQSQETAQPVGN